METCSVFGVIVVQGTMEIQQGRTKRQDSVVLNLPSLSHITPHDNEHAALLSGTDQVGTRYHNGAGPATFAIALTSCRFRVGTWASRCSVAVSSDSGH